MSEQRGWGWNLPRRARAVFIFGSMLSLTPASAIAGEINACKYGLNPTLVSPSAK